MWDFHLIIIIIMHSDPAFDNYFSAFFSNTFICMRAGVKFPKIRKYELQKLVGNDIRSTTMFMLLIFIGETLEDMAISLLW